uniref:Uncharacterized protein n=1 Tax=Oryza rufipogon TaxID=4529 RepID=A0A0E0QH38_ORYRU
MDFPNVKVSFAGHSCNRCAHDIARLSVSWDLGQMSVWADPLPEYVNVLVARDRIGPMNCFDYHMKVSAYAWDLLI